MKISKRLLAGFSAVCFSFASSQVFAAYTQMISFGDSLSDSGNAWNLQGQPTGHPVYLDGRASDGPVWNELLADNLGIARPEPSYDGGTNYAFGGARVNTPVMGGLIPSVQTQVNNYLASVNGQADPNAIFTLTGGGNDLNALIAGTAGVADVTQAALDLSAITQQLVDAGANSVILANVPDLGQAPVAAAASFTASYITAAVYNFNLSANGEESQIFDTFALHTQINADPAAYGFTNLNDSCLDAVVAGTISDCAGYVFADSLHPTQAGSQAFADAITPLAQQMSPVPVPAALPLFASALVGLGFFRRKA